MKKKVIAIVGPTAVGKTKLGIEIAKRFGGEIISGDSMQIYIGMDIGTAKVTDEEKAGIPHHLIDLIQPGTPFSAADFQYYARKCIDEITERKRVPLLVGGSGLYVQAALYDYQFSNQKRDPAVTKRLERKLLEEGAGALQQYLEQIDPVQAKKIHPNNHRRLIRALEIYETTGRTMTEYHEMQRDESPYEVKLVGLEMNREQLYDRINRRVDKMIEDGLVSEARELYEKGLENTQSMKAIGYKEFIPYFKGELDLHEAVEMLKQNSRRYAKRQYTWFKNKMKVQWYVIEPGAINEKLGIILDDLAGFLKEK